MPEYHLSEEADGRRGILSIGNLIVDKTHELGAYPVESMLEVINHSSSSPGGGVINVLFDLSVVDPAIPLFAAGLIGADEDGAFLLDEFSRRKIDTSLVGRDEKASTSFTHVMISRSNATRTFFHSHGANSALGVDHFRRISCSAKIAHVAYLLLLQNLDKPSEAYGSCGAEALSILKAKGFRTSLDLVSDPDGARYERFVLPALKFTDYLVVNDVEAAKMTGLPTAVSGNEVDWEAAVAQARLLLAHGVSELVAIHFPMGSVAVTAHGEECVVPSYNVPKAEVVSTLGAGDAFCAGMLYGIHQQYSLKASMKLGSALAHFNLFASSATDGAVSLETLVRFIENNADLVGA